MSNLVRSIIDGNEAADAYCRYMRPARRDGDKLPVKQIPVEQREKREYARDLNNYLDRLVFGYEAVAPKYNEHLCLRCHQPLSDAPKRLKRSIYERDGRIDFYEHEEC